MNRYNRKKYLNKRRVNRLNTRIGLRFKYWRANHKSERKIETNTVGQLISFLSRFPKDMIVAVEDGYADSIIPLRPGFVTGLNWIVFNGGPGPAKQITEYPKEGNFTSVSFGINCFYRRPPLMDNCERENGWTIYGMGKYE